MRDNLAEGGDLRFHSLLGSRVYLRPLYPRDYEYLYMLVSSPENLVRWRFRGRTPGFEAFVGSLWNDVLVQFMVVDRENQQPIGLVSCMRPDFRNGVAYLAAALDPTVRQSGWPLEGLVVLIDYLFLSYPLRKFYLETMEYNAELFRSAVGRVLHEEGRLRQHEYHDGRYWDYLVYALYRDDVADRIARVMPEESHLVAPPMSADHEMSPQS